MSFFYWDKQKINFHEGETIGFALFRNSKTRDTFGSSPIDQTYQIFCGIGACHACLIYIEGKGIVEACMETAAERIQARPITKNDRFDSNRAENNNEDV